MAIGRVYIVYNELHPEYRYVGRSFKPIKTIIPMVYYRVVSGKMFENGEIDIHNKPFKKILRMYGMNHLKIHILYTSENILELEDFYQYYRESNSVLLHDYESNNLEICYDIIRQGQISKEVYIYIKARNKYFIYKNDQFLEITYNLNEFCKKNKLRYDTLLKTFRFNSKHFRTHYKRYYIRRALVR